MIFLKGRLDKFGFETSLFYGDTENFTLPFQAFKAGVDPSLQFTFHYWPEKHVTGHTQLQRMREVQM